MLKNPQQLADLRASARAGMLNGTPRILVGMATCGLATGAQPVFDALHEAVRKTGVRVKVGETGCNGACYLEPLVDVVLPGQARVTYANVQPDDTSSLVELTAAGRVHERLAVGRVDVEAFLIEDFSQAYRAGAPAGDVDRVPSYSRVPFFCEQVHVAMRNCGIIDPTSIEEYIAKGGYAAAVKALIEMWPDQIIQEIKKSGLRGRGGGGFPTGRKWETCRNAHGEPRYIICNADGGGRSGA